MTGFELLDRLSANGRPDFVIFITAYDQTVWQEQALAKGAGYFPKPFSGHDLVAAIRQGRKERAGSSAS
jgi:CheY-like chemotaxis protein